MVKQFQKIHKYTNPNISFSKWSYSFEIKPGKVSKSEDSHINKYPDNYRRTFKKLVAC